MSVIFNEDQIDALKEFMNISLGASTAKIAELLDAFATMHIPLIDLCDTDNFTKKIKQEFDESLNYHVSKQLFTGDFGGECMFVLSENSANNLGVHLYNMPSPCSDDINDAVMELTNILSSTIVSRLTQELNTQVQFFVPSSQFVKVKDIVNEDDIANYSKIIIIKTVLEFKDQKIVGNIYILTKDEAISKLRVLIDKQLEEIYK